MSRKERARQTETCENEIYSITSELLGLLSEKVPASSAFLWDEYQQVSGLVTKLMDLQKEADDGEWIKKEPDDVRKASFVEWCTKVGIRSHGVRLESITGFGWGVVADQPLAYGTKLLEVPRRAMLTVDAACKGKMKTAFAADPVLREMSNVALAVCVANEKLRGQRSFWQPYLDMLPEAYAMPLFFSIDDMQLVKGCSCFDDVLRLSRSVVRQYAYFRQRAATVDHSWFHDGLFGDRRFTFRLYRWAVGTVMTRINFVPASGTDLDLEPGREIVSVPAMIPFLDMFNHAEVPQCSDFDDDVGRVFASREYTPGEQVFIYYGPRPNRDFFFLNGFVCPGNTADRFELNLSISKSDKNFGRRAALLADFHLSPKAKFVLSSNSPTLSNELLLFAAVFVAKPDELDVLLSDHHYQHRDAHFLVDDVFRPETVAAARKFLDARLNLLLARYSPSSCVYGDSNDSSFSNRKLALEYVNLETSVLKHNLALLKRQEAAQK
ncbi:unnamed protein product [Soboliphyme baturini]|uniref:protein-histidine N-methyltransferase n=1 Tax=Soboliphyme baturini TaxID=241478 RepID=A0A183IV22_9BILA|nr:unnamed protein product [Soboliphyme baturini]